MVDQLRASRAAISCSVTIGDFADVPVPGTYRLIFVVWNTLFNLLTRRPGALLRERRRPSHRRRLVRRGGPRAGLSTGCATINTWMQRPSQSTRSGSMCCAMTRRRRCLRRATCPSPGRASASGRPTVRLAERARSHGANRGAAPEGPLGRWDREPFNSSSSAHVSVYGR